ATALTSGTLKCCSADDSRLAEFSLSSAPQLPSALGSSRRARLPCFLLEPAADACGVPLNACDFRPANGLLFLSLADQGVSHRPLGHANSSSNSLGEPVGRPLFSQP